MRASNDEYKSKIKRVMIGKRKIKKAVKTLGVHLDKLYGKEPLLLVGILNGSFVFTADVCRAVSVPCEIAFIGAVSYYDGTQSSGNVKITKDIEKDISGYHVVILEDIIDTGRTLFEIVKILKARSPRSLRVVTLLDKPSRRVAGINADISLFTIPDVFVVGYGLDCAEKYRNLPYIAEFEE